MVPVGGEGLAGALARTTLVQMLPDMRVVLAADS
jgi:hypothetical protein